MRTITDATLYIVKGPRGPYYAVRENATGMVLTERTEHAAMAMAHERDMVISDRVEISHADLLAMMVERCKDSPGLPGGDQPQVAAAPPVALVSHSSV